MLLHGDIYDLLVSDLGMYPMSDSLLLLLLLLHVSRTIPILIFYLWTRALLEKLFHVTEGIRIMGLVSYYFIAHDIPPRLARSSK